MAVFHNTLCTYQSQIGTLSICPCQTTKLEVYSITFGLSVIICIARASRELFPWFYILFSNLLQFESSVVIVSSWSKVFVSFLISFASFLILHYECLSKWKKLTKGSTNFTVHNL